MLKASAGGGADQGWKTVSAFETASSEAKATMGSGYTLNVIHPARVWGSNPEMIFR